MPPDASQISRWLKDRRTAAGLTQLKAADAAQVGYGVVTNSEQGGEVLGSNFIALVMAYNAEEALVKQIREWRAAPRQSQGENGDGPDQPGTVPRPAERPTWPHVSLPDPSQSVQPAKRRRKKRGA